MQKGREMNKIFIKYYLKTRERLELFTYYDSKTICCRWTVEKHF